LAIRSLNPQASGGAAGGILFRPKGVDSGIPRPKIFGHNAPESPGCRRPIGETAECSAATAIPGKNFRGASAKDKPGVPRIEENEHDIVVL
jgi:hypothetical protein